MTCQIVFRLRETSFFEDMNAAKSHGGERVGNHVVSRSFDARAHVEQICILHGSLSHSKATRFFALECGSKGPALQNARLFQGP